MFDVRLALRLAVRLALGLTFDWRCVWPFVWGCKRWAKEGCFPPDGGSIVGRLSQAWVIIEQLFYLFKGRYTFLSLFLLRLGTGYLLRRGEGYI